MPNYFHLAVWPTGDGDLGRYMQWLLTSHVRRYHRHYGSSGHVWQGRFKAFPIQEDHHLIAILRYIERNPVRAGLVGRAEDWRWSSAGPGRVGYPALDPGPVRITRGADWLRSVNEPQTEAEVQALRVCAQRGRPYGAPAWTTATADRLGLQPSLRPRGRPRKGTAPPPFDAVSDGAGGM
jgi:putative transposase